jgi:curved DNA-binding protein CbpA
MATTGPNDRYYRRLEVAPDASQAEIVAAYRRLAHGAHPDTHPEDPEAPQRFREITEAYELLTDPAQRVRRASSRGDGAASPIRVVVRTTPAPSGPGRANPTDPPVVLCRAPLAEDTPLRAGPVHVEPHKAVPAPVRDDAGAGDQGSGLLQLFSDLFDPFWRF